MLLDLTTVIAPDHPALIWARQQDNAHIALGHVGTHLDVYECRHIPLEAFRCPGVLADVRHTGSTRRPWRVMMWIWTPSRPGPSSFFAPAGSNAMHTGNPPIP